MKKPKTISKLKKELDQIFSRYIRYRDKGQCFTCSKKDDPKYMQNGHFNPRQYLDTRYDERNNNCQCYACNMLYGGNPATYALRLKQKYGDNIIEELEQGRWKVFKVDSIWYEEKKLEYTEKLRKVQEEYERILL